MLTALQRGRQRAFWIGAGLGVGLTIAAFEAPYVNWHRAMPPIDERPLVIRQDAKGDGRFLAPRSGNRRHRGIDLAAELGSPVRAIRSGRVIQVGMHRGLGRFVELEHAGALRSLYAHLNETTVAVGARVRQGAVIGTVGKSGNARHPWIMPHLHLEVCRRGEPIDPQAFGLQVVDASGGRASGQASSDAPSVEFAPATDPLSASHDAGGGES